MTALGGRTPAGALAFAGNGRGRSMFGRADHDAEAVADALAGAPAAGFFAVGEIGPVGGGYFLQLLHGHRGGLRVKLDGARVLLTGRDRWARGGDRAGAPPARGAVLTLTGRRADVLEPLAAETGGRVIVSDLSRAPPPPAQLLEAAGEVDVLVANAGPARERQTELLHAPSRSTCALDVNLRAPMLLAHGADRADGRARQRSPAVHVLAVRPRRRAWLLGLLRRPSSACGGSRWHCASSLAPKGVGVSVVLPGFIRDAGMFARLGRPSSRPVSAPSARRTSRAPS